MEAEQWMFPSLERVSTITSQILQAGSVTVGSDAVDCRRVNDISYLHVFPMCQAIFM